MNKRQKIFVTATIITILAVTTLAALHSMQTQTTTDKLKVVATFYPLAFFAQEIGGEKVTVFQIIPDNTEVHNWQPSATDILAVDEADIIVYNGASLDHWFEEDILPAIDVSNKIVVETTQGANLLEVGNHAEEETDHEHEGNYDPHTWISPVVAKFQAQKIYEALVEKDPNSSEYYEERWLELETRFEELDNNYMVGLETKTKTAIVVSHSAFGYLASRYGFEQHGVIGISADEQPSASTFSNIVETMIQHETYVVFVNPLYSDESAQTLRSELKRLTGHEVQILKLYFMLGNMDGLGYFEQQEKNLESLKIGLGA